MDVRMTYAAYSGRTSEAHRTNAARTLVLPQVRLVRHEVVNNFEFLEMDAQRRYDKLTWRFQLSVLATL